MDCGLRVFHGGARAALHSHANARRGGKLEPSALCRRFHRRGSKIGRIRGEPSEPLMRADAIVQVDNLAPIVPSREQYCIRGIRGTAVLFGFMNFA